MPADRCACSWAARTGPAARCAWCAPSPPGAAISSASGSMSRTRSGAAVSRRWMSTSPLGTLCNECNPTSRHLPPARTGAAARGCGRPAGADRAQQALGGAGRHLFAHRQPAFWLSRHRLRGRRWQPRDLQRPCAAGTGCHRGGTAHQHPGARGQWRMGDASRPHRGAGPRPRPGRAELRWRGPAGPAHCAARPGPGGPRRAVHGLSDRRRAGLLHGEPSRHHFGDHADLAAGHERPLAGPESRAPTAGRQLRHPAARCHRLPGQQRRAGAGPGDRRGGRRDQYGADQGRQGIGTEQPERHQLRDPCSSDPAPHRVRAQAAAGRHARAEVKAPGQRWPAAPGGPLG
mmetsp:Transcript_21035/g.81316  ORF Transcript_21035/g.81316 Transcript_21035/m.81316 type:complete len:346 (+) Transcript_21035:1705-2742(+)